MRIVEVEWKYGMRPIYEDVDDELLDFKFGVRVLPAQFYYEKKLYFTFIKKHEPGEKYWPEGGYSVRGPGGEERAYGLNQLIIHPFVTDHKKRIEKINKKYDRIQKIKSSTDRKRGRPSLSVEEKEKRALIQLEKPVGTGRRGRPPGITKPKIISTKPKGKRGRPSMSEEQKLIKQKVHEDKIAVNPERKRGRPSDPKKKHAREQAEKAKQDSGEVRRRGRPPGRRL